MSEQEPGSGLAPHLLWMRYKRYPYLLSKLAFFAATGLIVLSLLQAVEGVLVPILVSLFIAYLMDPAVDWFEERGRSRTNTIMLFIVCGSMAVAGFVLVLYPTIATIVSRIADGGPALMGTIDTNILPWVEETFGVDTPESLRGLFTEYGDVISAQGPEILQTISAGLGDVWSRTGSIIASLVNVVMIPIFTFYFLRDFDIMRLAAAEYIPRHNRDWIIDRLVKSDEVVGAWFRGQVEVAGILAVLYAIGLALTFGLSGIGVMSGVSIGVLAGLLNIVPYVGFFIGFSLSILLALLDWHGWGPVLGVAATFSIVQGLEGYVITPRIVGEKVGLTPVVVIIALLLGAELLGVLGVLLALPAAGILRVLWPDIVEVYTSSEFFRGEEPQPPVS